MLAQMGSVIDPGPLRTELLAELAGAHEPPISELRAALVAETDSERHKEIRAELRAAERECERARRALLRGFGSTAIF